MSYLWRLSRHHPLYFGREVFKVQQSHCMKCAGNSLCCPMSTLPLRLLPRRWGVLRWLALAPSKRIPPSKAFRQSSISLGVVAECLSRANFSVRGRRRFVVPLILLTIRKRTVCGSKSQWARLKIAFDVRRKVSIQEHGRILMLQDQIALQLANEGYINLSLDVKERIDEGLEYLLLLPRASPLPRQILEGPVVILAFKSNKYLKEACQCELWKRAREKLLFLEGL